MEKNNTPKTDLGMLLLTVIWGFGFIATRIAAEFYTANQIIFYRFLISSTIMLLIFRKDLIGASKRDIIYGAVLGLAMCLGFIFQTAAIYYTTVPKNAFLTTLNVIFVPILTACVHKDKLDFHNIAGCLLALIGTGVMSLEADFSINFGDILSILCAFFFSVHLFLQGEFATKTKTSVLATTQIVFAGFFSLITCLWSREIRVSSLEPTAVTSILYLALMCTCVSFFLQAYFQRFTSPVKAVVIFSFEAVFASIFAVIIFGEALTLRFLIGAALIFTAVIISSTKLVFLRVLTNRQG